MLVIVSQTSLGDKLNDAIEGMKGRTATKTEVLRTAKTRFASWEAGYGMIEDYLLTGVGVNQFANHAGKYLKVNMSDEGLFNPHNIFVKIFSEAGFLSFLSFLAFLFFLLKTRYSELINSEYFWITLLPVTAILMGMALNITYKEHFWLSFALLSNIILVYSDQKEKEA
jgi:O-antigen ligase